MNHLTTRPREAPPMLRPGVTCLAFKPWRSGGLVGFADLHVPAMRLKLFDCPVQSSQGKRWVALPAKPVLDRDKRAVLEDSGKPKYAPVLAWDSAEVRNRFSDAAVDAVLAYDPGAFGQEG